MQKLNSRGIRHGASGLEGDEDGERKGQALLPRWEQSTKARGLLGCRGNQRKRRGGVCREAPRSQ